MKIPTLFSGQEAEIVSTSFVALELKKLLKTKGSLFLDCIIICAVSHLM